MRAWNLTLHVLTPLHVGVGQGIGGVDLPVARQRPTGFPYIPGSTLKGCLRARLGDDSGARVLFGSEPKADLEAGQVFFGDAQLVAVPVRDEQLTFVWLTCPTLLSCAKRIGAELDSSSEKEAERTLDGSVRLMSPKKASPSVIAWIKAVTGHDEAFVASRAFEVSDDEFAWAAEFATQIDVRNRIAADSGVVVDGALWSEESLAPETLLIAPLRVRTDDAATVLDALRELSVITIGGKNTIGRGVCRIAVTGEEA